VHSRNTLGSVGVGVDFGHSRPQSAELKSSTVVVQAVLQLLCNNARKTHSSRSISGVSTSFYTAIVCEVILASPALSNDLLQLLLPFLLAGLCPSALPAFRAATYTIVACLLSQGMLQLEVATSLLVDLCQNAPAEQLHEALMLTAHALSTQCTLKGKLPHAAAVALASQAGTVSELAMLQGEGLAVDVLVRACAVSWCSHGDATSMRALDSLLTEIDVSGCAQALGEAALNEVSKDEPAQHMGPILRMLDARHTSHLDAAVRAVLLQHQGASRQRVAAAVHAALSGSVHVPMGSDGALTVAAAVTSASAALREQAVTELGTLALRHDASDATLLFVQQALSARLMDGEVAVVLAVLRQAALLHGSPDTVLQSLCGCLVAASARLFGKQGGCGDSVGVDGTSPDWSKQNARAVAKATMRALLQVMLESGEEGRSVGEEACCDVVAAVLPFSVCKYKSVGAAALETLRNLPANSILAEAVQVWDQSIVAECGRQPGKKKGGHNGKSERQSTRSSTVSALDDAASTTSAPVGSALVAARAIQAGLAHAVSAGGDTDRIALLRISRRACLRARHVLALALAAARHLDGAAAFVTPLACELLRMWDAEGHAGMSADALTSIALALEVTTGRIEVRGAPASSPVYVLIVVLQ
jgi:hypothetical protein